MRITKEKKQENHERIVRIASEMFRKWGFDGVGVADLMARAGLTHGGFYNHFASKEALIAEASAKGFGDAAARYVGHDAADAIELYISRAHRDARGQGCPAAALSCEAARQSEETKSIFGAGIEGLVSALVADMAQNQPADAELRAQAIRVFAQAVGAIVLSRACPDDSALADEILDVCRADCRQAIEKRAHRQ